MKTNTNPSLPL